MAGQPSAERHGALRGAMRRRDVRGVVGRRPVPRRGVGGMGAPVAGVGEPRAVLALQPGDDRVAQEGGHAVLGGSVGLGGQAPRRRRDGDVVAEPVEPGPPGVLLVGQVEPDVEARREPLVRREPGVVGPGRASSGRSPWSA